MLVASWRRWWEQRRLARRLPEDAEWSRVADLPQPAASEPRDVTYWLAMQFLVAMRALAQPVADAWADRSARAESVQRAEELASDLIHAATADLGPALRGVRRCAWEFLDHGSTVTDATLAALRDALLRDQGSDWERLHKIRRRVLYLLAAHGGRLTRKEMVEADFELGAHDRRRDEDDHLDRHLDELVGAGILERGGREITYRLVRLPAGTPRQVADLWRARWSAV
jgi:hypothetical protein